MSVRCKELGITLSHGDLDFCPTASASIRLEICGQATAWCPTASATGGIGHTVTIDLEPLRAQLRAKL